MPEKAATARSPQPAPHTKPKAKNNLVECVEIALFLSFFGLASAAQPAPHTKPHTKPQAKHTLGGLVEIARERGGLELGQRLRGVGLGLAGPPIQRKRAISVPAVKPVDGRGKLALGLLGRLDALGVSDRGVGIAVPSKGRRGLKSNWSQHRISNTNQHPISIGTK